MSAGSEITGFHCRKYRLFRTGGLSPFCTWLLLPGIRTVFFSGLTQKAEELLCLTRVGPPRQISFLFGFLKRK
ncbi:hypothetical protein OJAV_G00001590 [Oryzias javanicus]|uniref:Uncharacterized protein n=1 Tax=Oryzias javanicus TaxID=123683 RepID=A0A437DMH1_ORYJA|nr:hypothetical protein OJAV_G00001590 [Oryzias javanicus]